VSCEKLLLVETEKLGPVCFPCFRKTKRRDPLTKAAVARVAVIVVPQVCPHDEDPKHTRCRYSSNVPKFFNVITMNRKLEAVAIEGPFKEKQAESLAKSIRQKIDRRGK
jgi:hypothetical protein